MLLKTIDQFIAVIPTAAGVDNFADLKPYVTSAELWLKTNVLGTPLYNVVDALNETLDDSSSGAGQVDMDLINLCLNVIANHAYWDAVPFLDVVHTNSGFAVISGNNKVPASKERVERLRTQCLTRRDTEVESLITYLEQNIQYHDDWKGSPTYSVLSDCLIQTARELELYANWQGTRKAFLKLRPLIIRETVSKLEPLFSSDYLQELIEKQRDNDLTASDERVLVLLKQCLGSLIDKNGIDAEIIAYGALRYMDANEAQFPTYFASTEYLARIAPGYENSADSSIFSSLLL